MKLNHYFDNAELTIGQHKTIIVTARFEVDVLDIDEWSNEIPNHEEYVDGVKTIGELYFDMSPIQYKDKHPVRKSICGKLRVISEGESSEFTVLLLDKSDEIDVVPRQIKRYFWKFFGVGKPFRDELQLFPETYRGKKLNKVFVATNIFGAYPKEFKIIVVEKDRASARYKLNAELAANGYQFDSYDLEEISLEQSRVFFQ